VGKTDSPSNLSALTAAANGDSVSLYADPVSDPDIEGYEVRLGSAWTGGIFISFNKYPSLRLNGVRPGTHTFWIAAKDNAGNYSSTPVSATVTVYIPPGYSELATYGSWTWDFTTAPAGTFDNTEHVTYDATDSLKCSHNGDVLTGTWESDAYDLGSTEKVRVWGDFLTAFSSSDTTWNGVAPLSTQAWEDLATGSDTWEDVWATSTITWVAEAGSNIRWNDLNVSTMTWNEIFGPTSAGQVSAKLKYSEDDISYSEISYFEILCAEVYARYIKVEVTITDPTLDSNLYLKEINMKAYTGPQ